MAKLTTLRALNRVRNFPISRLIRLYLIKQKIKKNYVFLLHLRSQNPILILVPAPFVIPLLLHCSTS
uniref:Uncharacterized protein n=1 Tax=Meloidogyne enterolobii TaxID=390850 RepID=A0A6V7XC27_MELEN|nr:unnamed protein product [Meloidogyne enterolobii]